MSVKNFFTEIPHQIEKEIIETLVKSNIVRIERIISDNHSSPKDFWYEQKENEFVIVLKGEGIIEFENGEKVVLKEGDYLIIPSHKKHRVDRTSEKEKTIWLAIFYK